MPPVIPRFQFYMQLNMKPIIEYCKKLHDSQSVFELRDETLGLIKNANDNTMTTEKKLENKIQQLNERCDDLQS